MAILKSLGTAIGDSSKDVLYFTLRCFLFLCTFFFFNTIFLLAFFFFILTAEPAGHALVSIYILSF